MPTIQQIANFLNLELFGHSNLNINKISPFPPKLGEISFIKNSNTIINEILKYDNGWDGAVIADDNLNGVVDLSCSSHMFSCAPKYDLAKTYWEFFDTTRLLPKEKCIIDNNITIGASVKIDNDVEIGPGCVLLGDIKIGSGSRIGSNVVIKNKALLGKNVTILSGSVIGEKAFSFGFSKKGESIGFPSLSGVIIEDNVRIGNNVTISRGVFKDTEISCGTIIDDLTNIGNAVSIGKYCKIMANCSISGRVILMDNCFLGRSSAVRQGVKIGCNSVLGMGSIVVSDINENVVAYGVPAKVASSSLKS